QLQGPSLILGSRCTLHPLCWWRRKERRKGRRDLDTQAFTASPTHVDGFDLAALDTLQHRLARDAEETRGVDHRHVSVGCGINETVTQLRGQPDAPRRARCELLAGNEAVVDPTMKG